MEEIDPDTGLKTRKLTELKPSMGKAYQDAILNRVDYFSQKRDSAFNNVIENVIVTGLKTILNVKIKVDDMLGEENKVKFHNFIDKLLLFGL